MPKNRPKKETKIAETLGVFASIYFKSWTLGKPGENGKKYAKMGTKTSKMQMFVLLIYLKSTLGERAENGKK